MATKTTIEVEAISLAKAKEIFLHRDTATPAELLAAQHAFDKSKNLLKEMSEAMGEKMNNLNLPDLETLYGPNPMIVLVEKDPKAGTVTRTNVLFKEKMVTESTVDKKAILGLGDLVPTKYLVEKKDLDKTALLNDAMAGTLDPTLMSHVSVHTDLKFIIEKRSGGTTPLSASPAAPADDEAI
jgi:hypothetical protein